MAANRTDGERGISISGDVTGTITIGHGYSAEQVSHLLTQIISNYQHSAIYSPVPLIVPLVGRGQLYHLDSATG